MIDIIIPIYNSRRTLIKTLASIVNQIKVPSLKIYIIDDASEEEYDDILEFYKKVLNLKYVKLKANQGPGCAREYGLIISKDKYIIFLDSDDIFATALSINSLYSNIENGNYDVVTSVIFEEQKDNFIVYQNENIGLHGKIYRRKFIEENNIHFNNTRSNEDTGFNALIKLCGARYKNINELTYIWCNNENSITRKNKEIYKFYDINNFAKNMYWAIQEAVSRKCEKERINIYSIEALLLLYERYSIVDNDIEMQQKVIENTYEILKFYSENFNDTDIEQKVKENRIIDNFKNIKDGFNKFIELVKNINKGENNDTI